MNVEKTHMQQFDYFYAERYPGKRVPADAIFRSLNKNNLKKYFNLDVNFKSN
jgi:hypothetical protein